MKLFIATIFLLALLDAVTTYIIITTGRGVEANPVVAGIINAEPALVFPLMLASAAPAAATLVAVDAVARRMPPVGAAAVRRAAYIAFAVAVAFKAAVVINNIMIIVAGAALVDFLDT